MAKKAKVYTGTEWVDLAAATTDLSQYPNMTTTPISGFRNAIINGGFDIWQRGTSSFTANNIYTADRWWHVNDAVGATSVTRVAADSALIPGCEYFLRMTRTSGTNRWVVGTALETSVVKKFKGKTVTLSYWLRRGSDITANTGVILKTASAEGRFSSSVESSSVNITAAQLSTSTFTRFTQTLTIPAGSTATGLAVEFEVKSQAGAANAFLDIAMVQLEEGSIATPFEQRPIGTELALCQRYYQRITPDVNTSLIAGFNDTTTQAIFGIPFIQTMRVKPTAFDTSGTPSDYVLRIKGGATINCNALPIFVSATTNYISFAAAVASGLTAGEGSLFRFGNPNVAYLGWSAEL